MIKKISYSFELGNSKTKNSQNESKVMCSNDSPVKTTSPISANSSRLIAANYNKISFKGENPNMGYSGALVPMYKPNESMAAFENISTTVTKNGIKGNFYNKAADSIAAMLGTDKNILLAKEEGVSPELLIQKFAKNTLNGKYGNIGLTNYDPVYILRPENMRGYPAEMPFAKRVEIELGKLSSANKLRESTVFIDDFENFIAAYSKSKGTDVIFNRETYAHLFPNVRIVGMVEADSLEKKPIKDLDMVTGNLPKFHPDKVKNVRTLELKGLGANETKEFLKTNYRQVLNVLNKYEKVNFDISDEAIDAIVDGTARDFKGAFPKKALDVLDLLASSEATKHKSEDPSRVKIELTQDSVKTFLSENQDRIKFMRTFTKGVSFAENVTTKMSDVGGVQSAKEELQEIINFAKDPKGYLGDSGLRKAPKGLLMSGPPGTGKTLLARAVAGEAGVPFSAMSASEVFDKYVGSSEKNLRLWFENLEKAAEESGKGVAIGFIDEIDAIGKSRKGSDIDGGVREGTLNQLLTLIDGFNNKDSKNKIIILAATNRADILDEALVRPGRFDKEVKVDNPKTFEETLEVLKIHAKRLPFADEAEKTKILSGIAKAAKGESGAKLAQIIDFTARIIDKRTDNKVVTYDDMFEGFLESIYGKKLSSADIPFEEKLRTIGHEFGHALLSDILDFGTFLGVSNEPRGKALGATYIVPPSGNPTFETYLKDIAVYYAGGDAETLFNKETGHAAGVCQDYSVLTGRIEEAVKQSGLGINTPRLSFVDTKGKPKVELEKMYQPEIKKDIEIYSEISTKMSKDALKFYEEFGKEYLQFFKDRYKAGKGGNFFSAETFREMRLQWLEKTGRKAAEEEMKNGFKEIAKHALETGELLAEKTKEAVEETVRNTIKFRKAPAKYGRAGKIGAWALGSVTVGSLAYAGMATSAPTPSPMVGTM